MGGAAIAVWPHPKQKITTVGNEIGKRDLVVVPCHFVTTEQNNDWLVTNYNAEYARRIKR
jgi:hypothetical protein